MEEHLPRRGKHLPRFARSTRVASGVAAISVSWSATAGRVSSSGLFTAPNVFSISPVTVTATSQADTTKTASVTLQIGVAQSAGTMLVGHSTLEALVNGLYGGIAEGYQMTAATNGTLATLSVYVDAATRATNLFVGI
jgi:hypothetical protein